MAPASGTGGCLRRRPAPLAAGLFSAALDRLAGGRLFLYGGGRPGAAQSAQKTLRAVSDGSEIWRSAAGQKVQSLLWCDIDHDGAPELLLLVWRWGRFGKSRPFWKTEPDWGWSQHIDIYDWTGKNFRPAWMASDIGLDAAAWQFDEQQRLVITERSERESAWDWISWGLVRIA